MKNPRFLSLSCPDRRIQNDRKHCRNCPVDKAGYCEEFAEHILDNFSGLGQVRSGTKKQPAIQHIPLQAMLSSVEALILDNDNPESYAEWLEKNKSTTRKTFSQWLVDCYEKHRMLSFSCLQDQGKHDRCTHCIVGQQGHCEDFISFIESKPVQKSFSYDKNNSFLSTTEDNDNGAEWLYKLFVKVENNYNYSGTGSFEAWLSGIYNNCRRQKYQEYDKLQLQLNSLVNKLEQEGYTIELLAGEALVHKGKNATYATEPEPQPWDRDGILILLDFDNTPSWLLESIAELPNICVLLFNALAAPSLSANRAKLMVAIAKKINEKRGVLLRLPVTDQLYTVKKNINSKIKTWTHDQITMADLVDMLDQEEVEILAGRDLMQEKKINAVMGMKKLPGRKTSNLLLLDIRRQNMLQLLSSWGGMTMLVHGSGKGQLSERQYRTFIDLSDRFKSNDTVIIWVKDDVNPQSFCQEIKSNYRLYFNVESLDTPRNENEDEAPVNNIPAPNNPSPVDIFESEELSRRIEQCLERAFTDDRKKKCASLIQLYMSCYRQLSECPEDYPGCLFKKGKKRGQIKTDCIYDLMAKTMEKEKDTAKQQFRRCLKKGSAFFEYIIACLADYQ